MKKILAMGVVLLSVSAVGACSTTQQGAAVGATAGAIIGGVTTNSVAGAAVGAAVGGVTGAVVGKVAGTEDRCYYRGSNGRLYQDVCPRG